MQGGEIDCQRVGEGFVQWYYNQFDHTNRMELVNLYVSVAHQRRLQCVSN